MASPSSFGPAAADCADLVVKTVGTARIDSPLTDLLGQRERSSHYVEEFDRVLLDDTVSAVAARSRPTAELPAFEPAGPRAKSISIPPRPAPES